jgi:hypothetical protein
VKVPLRLLDGKSYRDSHTPEKLRTPWPTGIAAAVGRSPGADSGPPEGTGVANPSEATGRPVTASSARVDRARRGDDAGLPALYESLARAVLAEGSGEIVLAEQHAHPDRAEGSVRRRHAIGGTR